MARVEVIVPQVSMGSTEGVLEAWLKKVGDTVGVDEPVAIIEAAKTTLDVLAPVAGTLAAVVRTEGMEANAGDIIGYVDTVS